MDSDVDWDSAHRRTLMENLSAMERTSQSLARSQAVAAESEQIGHEAIAELGGQRESLLRAKSRLTDTDQELNRAQRVMNTMKRRILMNKFILILIIIVEIAILISCVYLRFLRK